ncbi:19397_t:CDS:2 [Gigaspora rosea]|nr:19397_t:CDS:2 [Gigaspora rosea]
MTEEVQETPIEVSSEATTSQQEDNNVVEWNRLQTADLKELELEPEYGKTETTRNRERKINKLKCQRREKINDQNEAFFAYFNSKLEERIDKKLTTSLSRILDRSLQQWTAKVNGVSAIESSFPKKKFKKARDQYEYDSLCDIGALLQKAIQEDSKEKFTEVQKQLRLRAFNLRVAEEEGWTVAGKILKPIPNEGYEFKDLLVKARKQAKSQEGYSVPYSRRVWQTKGKKFGGWSSRANYYTPYLLPTLYAVHTTYSTHSSDSAGQPHQNQEVIWPRCVLREEKRTGKYEERGDEQCRARQEGG